MLEAQLAAISVVSPGAKLAEVDKAARSVLKRSKLEKFFTHSTGHGVGLESTSPRAWLPLRTARSSREW